MRFEAKPKQVTAGEPVRLSWSVKSGFESRMDAFRDRMGLVPQVDAPVYATIKDGDGTVIFEGSGSGSYIVRPQQTTWYTLVVDRGDRHEETTVKVDVRSHAVGRRQ